MASFLDFGVEGNWPANREIDIMEYYNGKILANVAWKSNKLSTEWDSEIVLLESFKKDSWTDELGCLFY